MVWIMTNIILVVKKLSRMDGLNFVTNSLLFHQYYLLVHVAFHKLIVS